MCMCVCTPTGCHYQRFVALNICVLMYKCLYLAVLVCVCVRPLPICFWPRYDVARGLFHTNTCLQSMLTNLKVSVARFCCSPFGSTHFFSCFRFCLTLSFFYAISNVLYGNLLHSFDIFSRISLSCDNAGLKCAYICVWVCVCKIPTFYVCVSSCVTCPMKLYPFTQKTRKKLLWTINGWSHH